MAFLDEIKQGCLDGWQSHAILPSISGAQAILESNWGKSTLATKANNLFGIKGEYNGESFSVETKEFINGATKYVTAAFRKYPSWAESIADHSAFFTSSDWRTAKYAAVVGETDYEKAAQALSAAGYATDPDYPSKLIAIIEANGLAQWDEVEGETNVVEYINDTILTTSASMTDIWGVVLHNDAGSMTPKQYVAWLKTRNLELGIAHYYINRDTIARVVDTNRQAWHTATTNGNGHYIGYEVCESLKASDADFLLNEEMVFRQMAEDLTYYGLPANVNTVRLHRDFVSTSCPHRSLALHGGAEALRSYAIGKINGYMSSGDAVEVAPAAEQAAVVAPGTVTASILYLPNGQMWTVYPEGSEYKTGQVISTEAAAPDSGLYLKVLGDKGNNVLIVDLPDLGQMAIYYDVDKGATITQVLA